MVMVEPQKRFLCIGALISYSGRAKWRGITYQQDGILQLRSAPIQWRSTGYTQVYGVFPLICQSALRTPTSHSVVSASQWSNYLSKDGEGNKMHNNVIVFH